MPQLNALTNCSLLNKEQLVKSLFQLTCNQISRLGQVNRIPIFAQLMISAFRFTDNVQRNISRQYVQVNKYRDCHDICYIQILEKLLAQETYIFLKFHFEKNKYFFKHLFVRKHTFKKNHFDCCIVKFVCLHPLNQPPFPTFIIFMS